MEWKADDRDAYLSFLSTNPSSIHKRHRHIKSRIEESVSRKLIDGETLLARLQTQKHIPTGCKGFDAILGGGLKEDEVTEIYGLSTTGKTQLCHSVCAECIKKRQRVIYIDTTNSFSPRRILDLANLDEERGRLLLSFVEVYFIHDVYELQHWLDLFSIQVERKTSPSAIVIDSISSVLASICNFDSPQSYALMECMGRSLRNVAFEHGIPILVTNHEVGQSGNGSCALGNIWKHQVHKRVHLQIYDHIWKSIELGSNVCYIQITKNAIQTLE